MHRTRKISGFLALIFFVGLILNSTVSAKAFVIDSDLPRVLNINLDKHEVTLGEKINIAISASNENSKLGDNAYLTYVNSDNSLDRVKEVKLTKNEDVYNGQLTIDESFISGMWKPSFVVLSQTDNNIIIYNSKVHNLNKENSNLMNMSNGEFLVKEFANYKLFESVRVSMSNVKKFDRQVITINAKTSGPDLSEKAYALYVLENEFGTYEKELVLELASEDQYKCEFDIDESFRQGTWKLNYIILKDESGHNEIVYNKEMHGTMLNESFIRLAAGNFTIQEDIEGPEITNMKIESLNTVKPSYKVSVKVEDESNLYEKGYAKYVLNSNGKIIENDVLLTLKDGVYQGIFEKAEEGSWVVDYLLFKDDQSNTTCIYNNKFHGINSADLSALSVMEDEKAPSVKDIKVTATEIEDIFVIEMDVEDEESNLGQTAHVMIKAETANKIYEKEIVLKLVQGKYVAEFKMDDFSQELAWKVSHVIVTDSSNNVGIYYNINVHGTFDSNKNFEHGNFMTSGEDSVGPVFEGLFVSSREVEVIENKVVQIQIQAKDARSQLADKGYIVYRSNNGKTKETELSLVDEIYNGSMEFTQENYGEIWLVDYVLIKDELDNNTILYNSQVHGTGSNFETQAIKVNGPEINVSEIQVIHNDQNMKTIQIDVEGSTGELNAFILYVNELGEYKELRFKGNDGVLQHEVGELSIGKWQVEYVIVADTNGCREVIYNSRIHSMQHNSRDLSHLNIDMETELPKIESINVSSSNITLYDNETSTLTIEVANQEIAGEIAYVKYAGNGFIKEFKLPYINGVYQGEISVNSDMQEGIIEIEYIILQDKDDNRKIVYNSKNPALGQDLSAANITVENPEIGMAINGVTVSKSVAMIDDKVNIEVKVSKSAFELNEIAHLKYVQVENNMLVEKEIRLRKVDDSTYEGEFIAENIRDLGNWLVDYIIISDKAGNTRINYNNETNAIGTSMASGDIRIGDLVVHDYYNFEIYKGLDHISKFTLKNYLNESQDISLVVEVKDINNELLSKFKIDKTIEGRSVEIVDSRIRINENAEFVDVYITNKDGEIIYRLLENHQIMP